MLFKNWVAEVSQKVPKVLFYFRLAHWTVIYKAKRK